MFVWFGSERDANSIIDCSSICQVQEREWERRISHFNYDVFSWSEANAAWEIIRVSTRRCYNSKLITFLWISCFCTNFWKVNHRNDEYGTHISDNTSNVINLLLLFFRNTSPPSLQGLLARNVCVCANLWK